MRLVETRVFAGAWTGTLNFALHPLQVEAVKKQCLPPPEGRLNYPLLEEYDFRADAVNPTLPMELKPHVR